MAAAAGIDQTQVWVRKTLQLIDSGVKEFDQANTSAMNPRSVVLVGMTGVGKSTLINVLAGKTIEAFYDDKGGKPRVRVLNPMSNCNVGHSTLSETTIPRKYTIGNTVYWDMPGLADSRGIPQEIANAACIQKVFDVSREVKILFVDNDSQIMDDPRLLRLMEFIEMVEELFLHHVEALQKSVGIVLTGTPSRRKPDHLINTIGRLLEERRDDSISSTQRKILEVLMRQPICFFPAPVDKGGDNWFIDGESVRISIMREVDPLPYASGIKAEVTVSNRCVATVNGCYNELHRNVTELVDQFILQYTEYVTNFAAPYSSEDLKLNGAERQTAREKLDAIRGRLSKMDETASSVQTIPDLVQICQHVAESCGGKLDDCLTTVRAKVDAMDVLERYLTAGIHLPLNVVAAIREAGEQTRTTIEKALINLTAKDAKEKEEKERKRAFEAERRAATAAREAEAARTKLAAIQGNGAGRVNRPRPSSSCGGKKKKGKCAVM